VASQLFIVDHESTHALIVSSPKRRWRTYNLQVIRPTKKPILILALTLAKFKVPAIQADCHYRIADIAYTGLGIAVMPVEDGGKLSNS
jgi:hypothetical protein